MCSSGAGVAGIVALGVGDQIAVFERAAVGHGTVGRNSSAKQAPEHTANGISGARTPSEQPPCTVLTVQQLIQIAGALSTTHQLHTNEST